MQRNSIISIFLEKLFDFFFYIYFFEVSFFKLTGTKEEFLLGEWLAKIVLILSQNLWSTKRIKLYKTHMFYLSYNILLTIKRKKKSTAV